jgi:hypothetical protein
MLTRLMILSDQRRLESSRVPDFEATYRIVMGLGGAYDDGVDDGREGLPLGGLIYRELDSTRAGFED